MFFGGVNGSASADIAAIGPILIPAMVKEGYPAGYSCIVTATSAQLGPIIPPSLLMIIYGSIAELSIGRLFLAGYLPGLILTLFLSIVAYVMAIKHDHPRTMQRASLNEIIKNLKESWLVLLVPLVIVLGIVFGFFTPTESGVFAATISFVVSFFIYKTLSLEDVRKCLNATMKTSGKLMLIISAAYIFSWILTRENFAQHLVNLISNISTNPNVTMLLVMLILLLAGSILESLASLIMFGPMLLEVGMKAGFNPIHFAIVVIMTILIGGVTPPVGVGLYLTASIARIPVSEVLKYLFPFLLALISAALVVAFIPWLTTWGLGL
jgi:C4-dicarboxylate transporter DctM subunit